MAWEEIDSVILDDGERLTLRRDGGEFEIRAGLYQLMSSLNAVSESALAKAACADCRDGHVLIGGLGMGYTLRAVLDVLAPEGHVTVAELVAKIVEWNEGVLGVLAGHPLKDRRVSVALGDVANVLAANPGTFDAIMMDVDNGPGAVLFAGNDALYAAKGVKRMRAALKPGGTLVVWAASPDPRFESVLEAAGARPEVLTIDTGNGLTHTIYRVR